MDDNEMLISLAKSKMPYGRYAGMYLSDLPEPYVVWFKNKGFPEGLLGRQLALLYELKENGLEYLLREIRSRY